MSTPRDATEEERQAEWMRIGMRLAISTAFHPLDYAKTLVQLGYEPIPGRPGRSMFGKPAMLLPNFFEYVRYIRKADGWGGCYRGVTPKIVGSIISMTLSERLVERLELQQWDSNKEPQNDKELYEQFKVTLKRDIVLTASGVIFSYPFHVISVRMMAQFVGRETLYTSIFGSIREIYQSDGILGFFSGVGPRLLCDVACVILTSSTVYMINKYLIKDKFARQYNAGLAQYIFSTLLYPLQVVSTCMCVSGSRLVAGQPPIMPDYKKWTDCWNDLQSRNELKRGSSMFWRSISAPLKRPGSIDSIPTAPLAPYTNKAF